MMDCHMAVEVNNALRPNRRKTIAGEAFMNASTIGLERPSVSTTVKLLSPFGLMAGARAMNTLTLRFNWGWIDKAAKAWAVP